MKTASIALALLLALLALAWTEPAQAGRPADWTDGELALLPEYCVDTLGTRYSGTTPGARSPRAEHWLQLMGRGFWTLHHYCWGLTNVRRAQNPGLPRQRREFLIASAIDDYAFVLREAPGEFILRPEILTRTGEAHEQLGQIVAALEAFARARQVKPDYWPAYTREVDLMLKYNRKEQARQVLEEGLRLMPEQPELLQRRVALGLAKSP